MIPVDIHGMATDKNQEHYVVILNGKDTSSDKWLPIQISAVEAQNIAIQLNEMQSERPLTHDLLAEITKTLDGSVEEVRLDTEGTNKLHGRVQVAKLDTDEPVLLDAAPSDAIALALRTGAEIVVEEAIMQTQDPTQPSVLGNEHPSEEVTDLRQQLDEAVENEQFEKASELKDDIRDAIRRHEESMDDIEEDVDEQLEQAYEGSSKPPTEDTDEEADATDSSQ